ncbi:sodium-coupled monocarboxylate transporter 1-like [Oratosquilla oratoria]|uniref:sodium-coupled monocarboxylate transporter 1-like n=1 Tax=Oratosquilla oratoria TaxID=337810 RepID=UPI003F76EFF9
MAVTANVFGVIDYIVFVGMLSVSLGIGVYYAIRGNKSSEEFLLGGREMSPAPVAISLLSSFISAISLLGLSGESYAHGMQLSTDLWGGVFGVLIAAHFFVPVFYPLKLVSIFQYIDMRFKSKLLTQLLLGIGMMMMILYLGLCLYAPSIALSSVTPLHTSTSIVIVGTVCTIYSAFGGLKAVVWTDVFQLVIMVLGMWSVIVVGCIEVGGLDKVWELASKGGRTEMFNFSTSLYERHTFINTFLMGVFFWGACYGTSQINMQRTCCVGSTKKAQGVLYFNVVGQLILRMSVFLCGLCAYATYYDCDPMAQGLLSSKDQILPYFVMDKMGHIYGVPGLFVAALFSGALSSLSSVINSVAAVMWDGVFQKLPQFQKASNTTATVVNKIISLVTGGIMIGLAFLAGTLGGLIQACITITSSVAGPTFGVFLLGVFFPKCSKKGAIAGLLVSWILASWITMGQFIFKPKPEYLPFNDSGCYAPVSLNVTGSTLDIHANITSSTLPPVFLLEESTATSTLKSVIGSHAKLSEPIQEEEPVEEWGMMSVYGVSYTWCSVFSPLLCIFAALLVTLFEGGKGAGYVPPELIHPWVRSVEKKVLDSKGYYAPV